MKALSIHQPWALFIATGQKDVENRTWPTPFRGRFLIHAGKTFDYAGYKWIASKMGLAMPEPGEFKRGGIIGAAEITACVTHCDSPWFFGPYGFVLKNAQLLPFVPLAGRLGFFAVEEIQEHHSI